MFGLYQSLPFFDQALHGLHFMLCCFSVLVAIIPMSTAKGAPEHKIGGLVYLPLSLIALALGCWMAWRESSLVLFCFNGFCAYLLLSGWRATHESAMPKNLDWAIPGCLFFLALAVTLQAMLHDQGMRSFYLIFFAVNAFYLCWRDIRHLSQRRTWARHKVFLGTMQIGTVSQPTSWMGRHVAGMIGSFMANLSVVVLTLLPLSLHWLWPVSLVLIGAAIAYRDYQKKRRVRQTLAAIIQPKFRAKRPPPKTGDERRKAA